MRSVQRVLIHGLETHEQTDAARARGEAQQFFVLADELERGLAAPSDLHRDQRLEELVGVLVRQEDVVVDEEEALGRIAPDFLDHVLHRAIAELPPVHERHGAEVAAQRAATPGLRDHRVQRRSGVAEQVLARHWHVGEVDEFGGLVDRLQLVGAEVGHQLRPHHLDFVDDDGVEVLQALLDHEGRVTAAADDPDALLAEVIRDPVAARRLAGHHGDAHEVGGLVEIEALELFLNDLDLVEIAVGQRRDYGQIEMVDVLALHALDFQTRRRDQQQLHRYGSPVVGRKYPHAPRPRSAAGARVAPVRRRCAHELH